MTIHFIGIGGAGMSGIARVMIARGEQISGSDARDSRRLSALAALGAQTYVGHAGEHIHGARQVVISSAIPESNVELIAARAAGLPVLTRAQALGQVMANHRSVAVAGTHGKTTTTSMLTVALHACGVDPTYVIGSELNESGSNAHAGADPLFIAESDESDGSFLQLPVDVGIVTNVEPDHMEYWGTVEALESAFQSFVAAATEFAVICLDDPGAAKLQSGATRTYGFAASADTRIEERVDGGYVFHYRGRPYPIRISVPGRHNVLNAAAAFTAAADMGFDPATVITGLERFTGTKRRFEFKGEAGDIRVFDDYAHHPTEVVATLEAARAVAGDGRLIVVFQAHRYSRTSLFTQEFGAALGKADAVVVLEVYSAGEAAIPGVSGQTIAHAVPLDPQSVYFEPSMAQVPARVAALARPGDTVMTMGAGDVGLLCAPILSALRGES
jgi:UDP-N-acetylmuramate--alanine ligase